MYPLLSIRIALLIGVSLSTALQGASQIQFRADFYQRDLQTNTIKGRGKAWLKGENREVWADSIEFDFNTNRAVANGNVRVKESGTEMWCSHLSYAMNGEEAALEDAIILIGKLVMTGKEIHKHRFVQYEIEEGTYSNCNTKLENRPDIQHCSFDWKIYGSHFHIVTDEYAHISDALVYIKGFPTFYTPYFIFPVKTERQTGILGPRITYNENLGSGFSVPIFLALAPWQDLTLVPTNYSRTGAHLGFFYRYIYSHDRFGTANFFLMQRRFSALPDPAPDDKGRAKTLGLFGEWAVDIANRYHFSGRTSSIQTLRLVSNPYYTVDHSADLALQNGFPSLRSQASINSPGDSWWKAATVTYHQNLVISKDEAVDRGSVVQLPTLFLSRANTPLFNKYLSYELDAAFTNYYRPVAFDNVPNSPVLSGIQVDEDPKFDSNDYLRTGRRLHIEPRLIVQVPLTSGVQFQPVLKAGSLFYHFDLPSSGILHREYLEGEFPLSLYLTKNFETGIDGFEKLRHIFQPRMIYASRPFQSGEGNHPFFFYRDPTMHNPRFDIIDQVTEFEYMRFELINRLLRKLDTGVSRFFSLQISEQYNLRRSQIDPRFQTRLGPIEVLADTSIWRLNATFQALFGLEEKTGTGVRENDWSSSLGYTSPSDDSVQLSSRFVSRADTSLNQQSLYISFYKHLLNFLDTSAQMEYSLLRRKFVGYRVGFYLEAKPRSCWGLRLDMGRDSNEKPFVGIDFKIDFGNPSAAKNL